MAFRILKTKDDSERYMRDHWAWESNAAAAIKRYPEFRFSANGRLISGVEMSDTDAEGLAEHDED